MHSHFGSFSAAANLSASGSFAIIRLAFSASALSIASFYVINKKLRNYKNALQIFVVGK